MESPKFVAKNAEVHNSLAQLKEMDVKITVPIKSFHNGKERFK